MRMLLAKELREVWHVSWYVWPTYVVLSLLIAGWLVAEALVAGGARSVEDMQTTVQGIYAAATSVFLWLSIILTSSPGLMTPTADPALELRLILPLRHGSAALVRLAARLVCPILAYGVALAVPLAVLARCRPDSIPHSVALLTDGPVVVATLLLCSLVALAHWSALVFGGCGCAAALLTFWLWRGIAEWAQAGQLPAALETFVWSVRAGPKEALLGMQEAPVALAALMLAAWLAAYIADTARPPLEDRGRTVRSGIAFLGVLLVWAGLWRLLQTVGWVS
ncbi:MAG TPA: hypothetical protein DGT21_24625 [Armatimonadetes bacterium]|jgi:hypothetical protein|nr:hypothetical protein [Armatimonadota bacterium]